MSLLTSLVPLMVQIAEMRRTRIRINWLVIMAISLLTFIEALSEEMEKEENLFFSPYSISQVLAMAYAGARVETERQMADALRYTLPQERLHPAFSGLDSVLRSRSEDSYDSFDPDGESTAFRLNISNAVWGQDGFKFHGDYLNVP